MSNQAPKVDAGAKLLFILSAVALLGAVYVLVSSLINTYNKNSTKGVITANSKVEKAAENLMPIGVASTSDAPVAVANTAARSGKEVYSAVCQACHATGVAGSPKFGDAAAWKPRVATGLDSLLNSAMNGKGAMPARGGNPSITDDELKATIIYMAKEAGFDLGGNAAAPAPEKKAAAPKAAEAPETKTEVAEVAKAPEAKKAEAPKAPEVNTKPNQPETPKAAEAPVPPAAPVAAQVATASATTTDSSASLETGKKVYNTVCFACHKTGVAGSPVFGNKEAWAPRIATGAEALHNSALHGKGAMPPKGGNASLSDEDVKAAVDYMVSESH